MAEVAGLDLGRGDDNTHHVPVALLYGHNFDIIIRRFKRVSLYYGNEKLFNPPAVAEVGGWDLDRCDYNPHAILRLFPLP